ncbi:MAG: hypothetical protein SH868_03760 [Bythopirellula sp.]|nr:hypothetical protein [Bythopirellula sp.]
MTQRTMQFSALLLAFSFCQVWVANQANAQRSIEAAEAEAAEDHNEWYYGSEEKPKKSIAMRKAELRAEQRMDRLASQKWYGFVPGRPTASATPFTTMHNSPTWTRPGGQPFAWYTGYQQPIINNAPWGYRYW